MNNTAWKYTLQFINGLNNGEIFFTIDQLNYVKKYKSVKPSTLFDHRVILARLDFLEQTRERGVWWKRKSFPYDVGRAQAQLAAFSKGNWEKWFVMPGWPLAKNFKSEVAHGRT